MRIVFLPCSAVFQSAYAWMFPMECELSPSNTISLSSQCDSNVDDLALAGEEFPILRYREDHHDDGYRKVCECVMKYLSYSLASFPGRIFRIRCSGDCRF